MQIFKILFLLQLFEMFLFAQEIKNVEDFFSVNNIAMNIINDSSDIDPYSFFPSQISNFWQYSGNYIRTNTITKDSLLDNGTKLLWDDNPPGSWPWYMIDTNYNVIFDPYIRNEHQYILNSKIGDRWWVYARYDDSVFVEGQIAEVDTIYQGNYLGMQSTFKVFSYYFVYNNSGELEEHWDHDAVLASGMGLVYEDMDAEQPKVLIAAIINGDTLGTIVSVKETYKTIMLSSFTLSQNYPNPFNPSTQITYQIPENGFVSLIVYNSLGQIVEKLVERSQTIGKYSVGFNAANLPSGIYIYRLQVDIPEGKGNFTQSKKMILLR